MTNYIYHRNNQPDKDKRPRWWSSEWLTDVPEDVCPRREAVSGAIILWVFVFGLLYLCIGLLISKAEGCL